SMDAPFLPPPAADNPVPQKGSAKKTFFLWFALILLFLVIYNLFSAGPASTTTRLLDALAGMFSYAWPFLLIGLVFFYIWWQFRGSAQFQLAQEPGLIALAEGQLDKAASIFQGAIEKYRKQLQYAAVARHNYAVALRRQGKLQPAIDEFIRVEKG